MSTDAIVLLKADHHTRRSAPCSRTFRATCWSLRGASRRGLLVAELAAMAADAERFDAKTTVLIENVTHHMDEEEQDAHSCRTWARG